MILTGPSITKLEKYVNDAVSNGWNNNWNNYLIKLENRFKEYFKIKYAIPTSSCTGAMHSLTALGVKEGDEVIVPDTTGATAVCKIRWCQTNICRHRQKHLDDMHKISDK